MKNVWNRRDFAAILLISLFLASVFLHPMEASDFFLKLLVIIIAVKFFSEVLTYLNLSSLLWEAIAVIIVTQRFSYSRNFEQFCKV